jgi:hypothetical protein
MMGHLTSQELWADFATASYTFSPSVSRFLLEDIKNLHPRFINLEAITKRRQQGNCYTMNTFTDLYSLHLSWYSGELRVGRPGSDSRQG